MRIVSTVIRRCVLRCLLSTCVVCLDLDLDLDFRSGESHLMACKTPPIYFTFSGSGLILKVSICMKCQIFCSTTFYLV